MSAKCSLKQISNVRPVVEFGAFSAANHIYDVISLAVEMIGNIHGAFRPLNLDRGTDPGCTGWFLVYG